MIQNYLTTALRNLRKNKFFSLLNITGLAVGLACCMLIALYVYHETHYDRHHERAHDLFRVGTTFTSLSKGEDKNHPTFNTPAPLAAALQRAFPEIEQTARTVMVFDRDKTLLRAMENGLVIKAFNEPKGYFVDSTYFDLFKYEFVEGHPAKALVEPQSVVLSEDIARKLFGQEPASGRIVRISNSFFEEGDLDFRVTGVFRQPTLPTHLDGRFFMSLYSGGMGQFLKNTTDLATNNMFYTYLKLRPGSDGKALEAKLPAFVERHMKDDLKARGFGKEQFLVAVPDVHLSGVGKGGSKTYLYILGSIALFTLLIACVNFMNLSTARSARRASEVGVRKSIGASQSSLIRQFLSESVLLAVASLMLAFALAWMVLPFFNHLAERQLSLSFSQNAGLYGGFLALALATGLVAGIYPAFYLSSFKPVEVLKGKFANSLSAAFLRKGLVVFQFVIASGLILASLVIGSQMRYLQSKDLGFQKEQQIVIPLLSSASVSAYQPLKVELQRDSRIASVGASLFYPGIMNPSDMGLYREGETVEQMVTTRLNWVDYDFLQTLGIQSTAGRLFSAQFPNDTSDRIILNEQAVKQLGFSSPQDAVGEKVMFNWQGREYRMDIIGVTKDFHFESLHEPIEPYGFYLSDNSRHNYLIARADTEDISALLASIEPIWNRLVPGEPFEYSFLDEDFQKNYKADRQMASLVGSLTGIAILISCLGLFGLAAFAAERRTKEIGIRKVLGASVTGITGLLATDFLKLVFVALVIASPLAYWAMNRWLQDFAYRIDIQWWMFALAGLVAILIAFFTVSFQSVRAALANPVKSLRSE
ncbi:MAG: ABC transporter permease [Saprospiraceae bacterium]|nr:ABC transporter permease [Saprospiraceae bacterium]